VKVGITLLLMHRFDDSLWAFNEALTVRKNTMGELHPSTARIYNNIGCVHVELNEFSDARRAFESALSIQRNAQAHDPDSGPLMFGTATTLCNLGFLYRYKDMHSKASVVLKEAIELQEAVLGDLHPTVLSTLDNLADSCAHSGNANESLTYYGQILERFRSGGRIKSKKMIRAEAVLLYKMSRVHRQKHDREAQLETLTLALDAIYAYNSNPTPEGSGKTDSLERRIHYEMNTCREQLGKNGIMKLGMMIS
jgi:tetratricopeptide (TPR) repeat protein